MSVVISTSETIEFTRWYLALFYTGVAVFYTIRILFMKRNGPAKLIFPGARFCTTWWNHMAFRFFRMAIWIICVGRLFNPSIDTYLIMMNSLQNNVVIIIGNVLLTLGFVLTVLVHMKLGHNWRSGIDPSGPNEIITSGLYRYSRNPIFLCVAMSQLGFFLALPSVFTLVCLVIGLYALNRQAIAEENHLRLKFPDQYRVYCEQVHRWI